MKFTSDGKSVLIEARKNRGDVEICVVDEGVGIPGDTLNKIFDPLYQVDSSTRRSLEGTGMGLAVAKDLIEAHGGSIYVKSTPGVGSSFYFMIPIWNKV